ncbi:unnamed protein product, partial [Adineta steineri]
NQQKSLSRPVTSKPKPSSVTTIKSDKPRSAPAATTTTTGKKTSSPIAGRSTQAINKDKKTTVINQTGTQEQSNKENEEQSKEIDTSSDIIQQTDEISRPESVSFTNDTDEPFVESNTTTPIDETNTHLISTDPMTISFVDGAPNTRNPFLDQNDDIEIIHHNTLTST